MTYRSLTVSYLVPSRIFTTSEFKRFARKNKISDAMLIATVDQAEAGLINADLGGNVVKMRIARKGEGKSGGYRTIVAVVVDERAVYLFGYAKNEMGNVSDAFLTDLRETAAYLLQMTDEAIDRQVEKNILWEIER